MSCSAINKYINPCVSDRYQWDPFSTANSLSRVWTKRVINSVCYLTAAVLLYIVFDHNRIIPHSEAFQMTIIVVGAASVTCLFAAFMYSISLCAARTTPEQITLLDP